MGEMCGYEDMCYGEVKRDVGRGAREECGSVRGGVENKGRGKGESVLGCGGSEER